MTSKFGFIALVLVMTLCTVMFSCVPPERVAYDTLVSAKAFVSDQYAQHPECKTTPPATLAICVNLARAVSAKDALADALTVYCSGSDFANGGPCQPPVKGTPAQQQAIAKLQAASQTFNQIESDIKGAIK